MTVFVIAVVSFFKSCVYFVYSLLQHVYYTYSSRLETPVTPVCIYKSRASQQKVMTYEVYIY